MSEIKKINLGPISRQVWAFYHPFYGTPCGPTHKWLTWNSPMEPGTGYGVENTQPGSSEKIRSLFQHDPEQMIGPNRRDNYSVFYPTLGLYDTRDPKVLEQHVRWACEAGIDGFLWDITPLFPGTELFPEMHPNLSLAVMLEVLDRLKMPFQIVPWYDGFCWWSYPIEKICHQLEYLINTYSSSPHMLHLDGRFAIFTYSTFRQHTLQDWQVIRTQLEGKGYGDIAIIAGEANIAGVEGKKHWFEGTEGWFEGIQFYNVTGISNFTKDGYRQFHATLAERAKRANLFLGLGVTPGFDGRMWHCPGRVATRDRGELYEATWESAISFAPNFILVCSWNEWGEGTQIEPAAEYESLYLRLTRKWADIFKTGQENCTD